MSDHVWGDKDFDWKALDNAINDVYRLRKWGRLGGQLKEKYGTLRWYVKFAYPMSLHNLIYPGYCYSQFPKWLWTFDCLYLSKVLDFCFGKVFRWYQYQVYNLIYQYLIKKYPHIRAEILMQADYLELIKGVTREDGKKTHVLGAKGEILGTWSRG